MAWSTAARVLVAVFVLALVVWASLATYVAGQRMCMSETAVRMDMFAGSMLRSMLQQVLDRTRALQLVREVLAVLEVENAARVELHLAEDGVLDLRGVEDHVQRDTQATTSETQRTRPAGRP